MLRYASKNSKRSYSLVIGYQWTERRVIKFKLIWNNCLTVAELGELCCCSFYHLMFLAIGSKWTFNEGIWMVDGFAYVRLRKTDKPTPYSMFPTFWKLNHNVACGFGDWGKYSKCGSHKFWMSLIGTHEYISAEAISQHSVSGRITCRRHVDCICL